VVLRRLPFQAALLGLLAGSLSAQNPRIFPALFWGDNQWVSIKLANQSTNFKTVRVDVYRKSGEPIPLKPIYEIGPQASLEVRVDNQAMPEFGTEHWAWARVEQLDPFPEGLLVRTTVEVLRGNEILTFPVAAQAEQPSGNRWAQRTTIASNRDFYVLNTSSKAVSLTICVMSDVGLALCGKKDRILVRRDLAARGTMVMKFGKLPKRYLAIELTPAATAILGFLKPQKGDRHRFSSESSIQFDDDK
jgi:hypothetical protein